MKAHEFTVLLHERIAKMKRTLASKAEEYASEDDRLYNFKRAAWYRKGTPEDSLAGMLVKHWVKIEGLIARFEAGHLTEAQRGQIDEVIGDIVNYFVLLEATLLEQLNDSRHRATDVGAREGDYNGDRPGLREGSCLGTESAESQRGHTEVQGSEQGSAGSSPGKPGRDTG